jgi:hypothetical protein
MVEFAFGPFLRRLRLQYGVRVRSEEQDCIACAHGTSSVQVVCAALADRHYHIGCATYAGIECGDIVPHEAERFMEAIADCLGLGACEVHALWQKLAYLALCLDAGEGFARTIFPDALSLR